MCKWRAGCTPVTGESNGRSIGSTVSDAIVRSWLWSAATGSWPLIIDLTNSGVHWALLAIKDFNFTFGFK